MLWLHVLQNLKRLPKCFTDIKERTENKYIDWILINYSVLKSCSGLCIFPCLRSPVIIWSLMRLVSCSLPASVCPREPAADLQGEDSAFVRHPHSQPVWGRVSAPIVKNALKISPQNNIFAPLVEEGALIGTITCLPSHRLLTGRKINSEEEALQVRSRDHISTLLLFDFVTNKRSGWFVDQGFNL